MNILDVEKKKALLSNFIMKSLSNTKKLLAINEFFLTLINHFDNSVVEAYVVEFIDVYIKNLKKYTPFYVHPVISKDIVKMIEVLSDFGYLINYRDDFSLCKQNIENNVLELQEILGGSTYQTMGDNNVHFPLIEEKESDEDIVVGILESVTIRISKSQTKDSFIIVPSEKEIEQRIKDQVENSWEAARNTVKRYFKKLAKAHEVIISFDKREGIYEGNSLGTALTVGFIEALFKFYNTSMNLNVNSQVAFTGGMDSEGNVISVSKKIIEQKVECIFFSPIEVFVIPERDKEYAQWKLDLLHEAFPQRNLSIVGVENLDDLLDRRKIVDVKKRPAIVRAAKFSKKNWISLVLLIALVLVVLATGWLDFDNNPTQVKFKKDTAYIENKNGKVLWTYKLMDNLDNEVAIRNAYLKYTVRFTDINNDGTNEAIVTNEYFNGQEQNSNFGRVACFDNHKHLIWKYNFHDTVTSPTFNNENIYLLHVIGITKIMGQKVVYLMAQNLNLYPSAIFCLDVVTGKRIDSINTLWNAGTIDNALIGDFNGNNKQELVGTAIHNGFQRSVLFSVDLDKLEGQTPAPTNYKFAGIKEADLNTFILLPKSDYSNLYYRYDEPVIGSLAYNSIDKQFKLDVLENVGKPTIYTSLNYIFDNKLNLEYIGCDDGFQMYRDSLVARGVLKPPYSNTPQYMNSLKEQLRYWDGEGFVTAKAYEEMHKNKKGLKFVKK